MNEAGLVRRSRKNTKTTIHVISRCGNGRDWLKQETKNTQYVSTAKRQTSTPTHTTTTALRPRLTSFVFLASPPDNAHTCTLPPGRMKTTKRHTTHEDNNNTRNKDTRQLAPCFCLCHAPPFASRTSHSLSPPVVSLLCRVSTSHVVEIGIDSVFRAWLRSSVSVRPRSLVCRWVSVSKVGCTNTKRDVPSPSVAGCAVLVKTVRRGTRSPEAPSRRGRPCAELTTIICHHATPSLSVAFRAGDNKVCMCAPMLRSVPTVVDTWTAKHGASACPRLTYK